MKTIRRLPVLLSLLALLGFTWIPAGDLGSNRFRHRATLLVTGKVLLAGGNGNAGEALATAQLFTSPSTWTAAAPMAEPRFLHAQVRLGDGRVLVTGGHPGPLASAEIYDPSTDTWTGAAPMKRARASHTASLIAGGKVLVVGGIPGGLSGIPETEIYDPVTNTWADAASLNTGRYDHAAVVLDGGKVLVVGGTTGVNQIATCELYDPVLDRWDNSTPLYRRRQLPVAILLGNGKVLVSGGLSFDNNVGVSELITPGQPWSEFTGGTYFDRYDHAGALMSDGRVLVAGGYLPSQGQTASAEVYDPVANSWSSAGSMSVPRRFHTAVALPNGRVMIAGGIGLVPYPTSAEVFVPVDTVPPVLSAPALTIVEQTGSQGAPATIPASAVDDVDGSLPVSSDAPSIFPPGDTAVHLSATDHSGNVGTLTVTVRVVDTRAPVIASATATPAQLSPARNQMIPVTITVQASDVADPSPVSRITAVSSNGGSPSDYVLTGPLSVSLKAVKLPASSPQRAYTLTLTCTDRSGNSAQTTVTVKVVK